MDGRTRSSTAPLGITLAVVAGGADGDTTWVLLHGSDSRETDLLPFVDRADPGSGRVALRGAVPTARGHAFFDRRSDGGFDDDDVSARVTPPAPSGLTLPVLVVDGRHDRRRTPEDGVRTAERLRQGGADVEHVVLEVGHGITEDDERAVLDWLGRTPGLVRNTFPGEGRDARDR